MNLVFPIETHTLRIHIEMIHFVPKRTLKNEKKIPNSAESLRLEMLPINLIQ